jgi:hypothetical protein
MLVMKLHLLALHRQITYNQELQLQHVNQMDRSCQRPQFHAHKHAFRLPSPVVQSRLLNPNMQLVTQSPINVLHPHLSFRRGLHQQSAKLMDNSAQQNHRIVNKPVLRPLHLHLVVETFLLRKLCTMLVTKSCLLALHQQITYNREQKLQLVNQMDRFFQRPQFHAHKVAHPHQRYLLEVDLLHLTKQYTQLVNQSLTNAIHQTFILSAEILKLRVKVMESSPRI